MVEGLTVGVTWGWRQRSSCIFLRLVCVASCAGVSGAASRAISRSSTFALNSEPALVRAAKAIEAMGREGGR